MIMEKMYEMSPESRASVSEKQKASWSGGSRKTAVHLERSCARCGDTYVPGSASAKYCPKCRIGGPITRQIRDNAVWCEICRSELLVGRNRATDHCHESGMWRGTLCSRCNAAIGMLQNDPEICRAAAVYLEMWDAVLEFTDRGNSWRPVYDNEVHLKWLDTRTGETA